MFKALKKDKFYLFYIFIIFYIYFWFITHGSFNLFVNEYNGGADSLSKNLLKGSVETAIIESAYESYLVNGKVVSHFAPLSAVIRIPLNTLFPDLYGKWSRLLCLISGLFTVIGFSFITRYSLNLNLSLTEKEKNRLFYLSLWSFTLGSPLLYLISEGNFFHECRIISLCSSVWGIYYLIKIINSKSLDTHGIFKYSILSGLALLSKEQFGICLYAVLFIVMIWILKFKEESKNISKKYLLKILLISTLPALMLLGFQLWFNYSRFGNITKFLDRDLHYFHKYGPEIASYGGEFNPIRIPYITYRYFGVSVNHFSKEFPFLKMIDAKNFDNKFLENTYSKFLSPHGYPTFTLTIYSGWLIFSTLLSLNVLLKKGGIHKVIFLALFILSLLITGSLFFTSVCYTMDFLLWLIFIFHFFLVNIKNKFVLENNFSKIITIFTILCFLSIYSSVFIFADKRIKLFKWKNKEITIGFLYKKFDSTIKGFI